MLILVFLFLPFLFISSALSGAALFLWGLLFLWTLVFVVSLAIYGVPLLVIYNYFVFQEALGLLFLMGFGVSRPSLLILAKLGFSPFHAWGFYLLDYLRGQILVWFLVYQKLRVLPALLSILYPLNFLVLFGLFVLYRQVLGLTSLKRLVFVSSVESSGWLLLMGLWGIGDFYLLAFFYFLARFFSLGLAREGSWGRLVLVVLLFRTPVTINFFVKFFSLAAVSSCFGISFYLVLFSFPLSLLTLGYLFLALFTRRFYSHGVRRIYSVLSVVFIILLFFLVDMDQYAFGCGAPVLPLVYTKTRH